MGWQLVLLLWAKRGLLKFSSFQPNLAVIRKVLPKQHEESIRNVLDIAQMFKLSRVRLLLNLQESTHNFVNQIRVLLAHTGLKHCI